MHFTRPRLHPRYASSKGESPPARVTCGSMATGGIAVDATTGLPAAGIVRHAQERDGRLDVGKREEAATTIAKAAGAKRLAYSAGGGTPLPPDAAPSGLGLGFSLGSFSLPSLGA